MKLKLFSILLLIFCFAELIQAQDSTRRTRRSFDSTLFSDNNIATKSDYLASIERALQTFNKAPVLIESFSSIEGITNRLDEDDTALNIIKERLLQSDRSLNLRNLHMFYVLLEQLNDDNKAYNKRLEEYDNRIEELKKEVRDLRKDTLVRTIFRDSVLRVSFKPQLEQLRGKFRNADSLIRWGTTTVNNLKAHTASNIITTQELLYAAENQLKAIDSRIFGKERRYIWEPRSSSGSTRSVRSGFQQSIAAEKNITRYYFTHSRNQRTMLLVTGFLFFIWVVYNFRSVSRLQKNTALKIFEFRYINSIPILASLVFTLSLAPLFDLDAPSIYIEAIGFLMMITLTFFLWKHLPKPLFFFWSLFVILFLLLSFSRLLGLPFSLQRYWTLTINSAAAALGIIVLLRYRKRIASQKIMAFATGLYVFFNLLAVLCNVFGRVTLSQVFSATAFYTFVQTLALSFFVSLVTEASLLQIQASRIRKKYPDHFESATIVKSITKLLTALAVIIWLVVFTTNLNIYTSLADAIMDVLVTPRNIGSVSFTFRGAILFLGIIWAANFLQKYIAYFLGDTGDEAAFDNKGQRSRLLITRLVLLTCGFLLAVAASGLPMDKITVILGALGVGIGLGLQSIVNNFVSGIILIFDRPLRIGDMVEIGDKKGRVKEIGVRSSTLLTADGAEVIIPNGDVLSHNIVNWTLSNNYIRKELSIKLQKPTDNDELRSAIKEILKDNDAVLPNRDPEILIRKINAESVEVKLYYWCKDVTKTERVENEISADIYSMLDEKGIKIL